MKKETIRQDTPIVELHRDIVFVTKEYQLAIDEVDIEISTLIDKLIHYCHDNEIPLNCLHNELSAHDNKMILKVYGHLGPVLLCLQRYGGDCMSGTKLLGPGTLSYLFRKNLASKIKIFEFMVLNGSTVRIDLIIDSLRIDRSLIMRILNEMAENQIIIYIVLGKEKYVMVNEDHQQASEFKLLLEHLGGII